MNEKIEIYLGCFGKENIRLGQSLRITKRIFVALPSCFASNISTDKLKKYFINPYFMYNIKDINTLFDVIIYSTGLIASAQLKKRKEFFSLQKDKDYIIPLNTFNFLNEKVWPKIAKAFIEDINKSKDSKMFNLRMNLPVTMLDKLYKNLNVNHRIREFVTDFTKWLDFQFIGSINKLVEVNGNIEIILEVKF